MTPSGPGDRQAEAAGDRTSGLTHRTIRGMMWTAWGSGVNALLKVAVLVLLTRLLAPDDFGVVGAALIVVGFALTFAQLGLGPALVQRPVLEPVHVSTAFLTTTAFGLLCAAVLALLAPALAAFFRMPDLVPVVRALSLMFPIKGISAVAENLAQRELRFRWLANVEVVSYGGYGLVGVALALAGLGVWALVLAQLSQVVLRAGVVLWAMPPAVRPRPTVPALKELMGYGAPYSAANLGVLLANQADNIVVGRWLGPAALGLYSRAYQLMAVPTALFGDVLDHVLFPAMAKVQEDARRLSSAYLRGTALLALVMLPAGGVLCVLGPELIRVAFGERWMPMAPAFQLLALGMMFRTSYRMSDSLARATGAVYRRAWRQGVYAALVFAGALVGQPWGVTGVAAAVLGALLVNFLLMAHLCLSVSGVSWATFWRTQVPAFRLAAALALVTWAAMALLRHAETPALARLAGGGAAALGASILLAWRFPGALLGEAGIWMLGILRADLTRLLRPAAERGTA
jgi:PST family polysaccharide transporter